MVEFVFAPEETISASVNTKVVGTDAYFRCSLAISLDNVAENKDDAHQRTYHTIQEDRAIMPTFVSNPEWIQFPDMMSFTVVHTRVVVRAIIIFLLLMQRFISHVCVHLIIPTFVNVTLYDAIVSTNVTKVISGRLELSKLSKLRKAGFHHILIPINFH